MVNKFSLFCFFPYTYSILICEEIEIAILFLRNEHAKADRYTIFSPALILFFI